VNKKNIWGAIAALGALYLLRMGFKMASELKRYNAILAMSNEGTVSEEMPEVMLQVMKQERQTLREWGNFMQSAPKDLMRYLKIESM
jgi:hypothetical protein